MTILNAEPVPLSQGSDGVIRVNGTRVTLETVVCAFLAGATAEQIADGYDALTLADVYFTIAYYLRHRIEVDQYLAEQARQRKEVELRHESLFVPSGLRDRLIARQAARGR